MRNVGMSSTFPMSACVYFCVPKCTVHTETSTQSPSQPRQNTLTKTLNKRQNSICLRNGMPILLERKLIV